MLSISDSQRYEMERKTTLIFIASDVPDFID
jgi:hypothetical protein